MKKKPIYIFIISLLFGFQFSAFAQNEEDEAEVLPDSISFKEKFGLRVGIDVSKLARSFIDDNYTGFQIQGDYRLNENLVPAVELGHEDFNSEENYFTANSSGEFIKLGANYNVYDNLLGMQNEINVGLRYAFSTYSQKLKDYTVYNKDYYFPADERAPDQRYGNLNAHWIEFQIGLKAEVVNNVYLGLHAELKRMISETSPSDFESLWIPGYNRNYDHSAFGVGWGYSITYLIPITKKEIKTKRKD